MHRSLYYRLVSFLYKATFFMKKALFYSCFISFYLFNAMTLQAQTTISYQLSFPEPHTHYIEVQMTVKGIEADSSDIKMAAWTPGSYLIREYAKNVETVQMTDLSGAALPFEKITKNTWRLQHKETADFMVTYRLYAYELSVRTSFVNAERAALNGASVFMYIDGFQKTPVTVNFKPHNNWKTLTTPMKPVDKTNPWLVRADDFDTLVDSPIEIGNQEVTQFEAVGLPHTLSIYGGGNHSTEQLVKDIQKIAQTCTDIFGENPCDDYTILLDNTNGLYGGLEHLFSTSLLYPRWNYQPKEKYVRWLGLMSHEYFHLWNVKRLRPIALGPFDYENENYTHSLWVAEGVTSYYDDLILRRAELITAEKYLGIVASNITNQEKTHGDKVQSATEASFDAWIKYYRPNENFNNCCVSYYLKGALLSTVLDLEILHSTKGKQDMDAVLQILYNETYKEKKRGFTEAEFQEAVERVAGKKMDDFFKNKVAGTEQLDYQRYLDYVGLKLVNTKAEDKKLDLGATLKEEKGKLVISKIPFGTPAYKDGLNVDDEIIAINGYRVTKKDKIDKVLSTQKEGDKVDVTISRNGVLQIITLTIANEIAAKYALKKVENPTASQRKLYRKWLRADYFEKAE